MKTLSTWFDEYGESHQNQINKRIHFFCVPAIFFSICGLLMSIPEVFLNDLLPRAHPLITNWAFFLLIFVNLFYMRLSPVMGFKMLLFSGFCLLGNFAIGHYITLWLFSLLLFSAGWIGQFYGHKVEGKKPSFLKDLQFLLIGPAWVIDNLNYKK